MTHWNVPLFKWILELLTIFYHHFNFIVTEAVKFKGSDSHWQMTGRKLEKELWPGPGSKLSSVWAHRPPWEPVSVASPGGCGTTFPGASGSVSKCISKYQLAITWLSWHLGTAEKISWACCCLAAPVPLNTGWWCVTSRPRGRELTTCWWSSVQCALVTSSHSSTASTSATVSNSVWQTWNGCVC